MRKIYLLIAYLLTHVMYVVAQNEITVTDADVTDGPLTWTADNVYILDGYVFVEAGGVLTIEPGTVIKGLSSPTTADPASALIVSRGAKILAEGTASSPIIFTSSLDDLTLSDDLGPLDRGLWGGVVILGNAPGGFKNEATEFNIEGIPTEGYGDKALYGGNDAADNSGVLKYVSIRHGGAAIAPDNEINGLTLGSVGLATTIEYVEIFANEDDGIEWFGGTVNGKYLVAAFCGDEAFDYDQSWDGKGQFLFSITGDDTGERGFEIDGSEAPSLNPKTSPIFSNVTQIGAGSSSSVANNDAFRMKSDGAGKFYNSIWTEFSGASVRIDDTATFERFEAGDIAFTNNIWFNFGRGGNNLEATLDIRAKDPALFAQHMTDGSNAFTDPGLRGISRTNDGGLDPRPVSGSSILSQAITVEGDFFTDVPFIGAFGETNWAAGWSALTEYGVFADLEVTKTDYQTAENGLRLRSQNPIAERGLIYLTLPKTSNVNLQIFDMAGVLVFERAMGTVQTGETIHHLELSNLETGIYLLLATTDTQSVSTKISIVK